MYTDTQIEELIKCEKVIIEPPTREYKEERGHRKKNFTLQSVDGQFNFSVFIRESVHFKENFSIGMDYNPREEKGTICLLRFNGKHGGNTAHQHHFLFHIHKASAYTINSGLKPESNIEKSEEYASLEEAIQYFIKMINLATSDRKKYFPPSDQQLKIGLENE